MKAKRWVEAEEKAGSLQEQFESLFDKNIQQQSFLTKEEFLEFKRTAPMQFEWIDWGYIETLKTKAFIAIEKREFPAGLAILATIERLAPTSAGAALERGYTLNQLGRAQDALDAYKKSHELSVRYASQIPYRAASLRGMAVSLVELHRLDEAEMMLNESLKIEPANKVALGELAYIRSLRGNR